MMHGQKNIKLNFSFRFQHLTYIVKFNLNHLLNVIGMEACQALTINWITHEKFLDHRLTNQTGLKYGLPQRSASNAKEMHLFPCRD